MWYPIITSIKNYLNSLDTPIADSVVLGLPEARPEVGKSVVYLCRLDEEYPDVYHGGEGSVNIEIGCFLTYTGTDMGDGYSALDALEQKLRDSVFAWANQSMPTDNPEIMQVSVVKSGGQPFEERPTIGSFMEFRIDWSKRTL